MQITMRERISLRVLGSSLLIGAGVFATAHGCPPELVAAVGAGTSLAENALVTAISGPLTAHPNHAKDVLCNRNLTDAVGETIKQVISDYIKSAPKGPNRNRLTGVAQAIPTRWQKLMERQNLELAQLSPSELTGFVASAILACSGNDSLTPDVWQEVVVQLADKQQLPPNVLADVAEALHVRFAEVLCSILTSDADDNHIGKKAYNTLSLALLGENFSLLKKVDAVGADTNLAVKAGNTVGLETHALVKEIHAQQRALQQPPDEPVSGWHELPVRNLCFTGRGPKLEEIHNKLQSGRPIALTGMGGVGKTDTALEYIHLHYPDKRNVYWINADTPENIDLGFADIARRLHLRLPEKAEPAQVRTAVKRALDAQPGWLLIFNNIENAPFASQYYPPDGTGNILLTTRPGTTGLATDSVELLPMDPDEGALLLLRRSQWISRDADLDAADPQIQEDARELSKELGGLPLALDQAGAYMEPRRKTPAQYLALYKQRSADLLNRRGNDTSHHPDSVTVTFSLAFDQLKATCPAAADLLRLCAFLAPDAIPEEIFTQSATDLGEHLNTVVTDELAWDDILRAAEDATLLRHDAKATVIAVHRLVQEVIRQYIDTDGDCKWGERTILAINSVLLCPNYANRLAYLRLLPHALACIKVIEDRNMQTQEVGHLLYITAEYLGFNSQIDKAKLLMEKSLAVGEAVLGPEHPDVARALTGLIGVKPMSLLEGEVLLKRALAICEKWYGSDSPMICSDLDNLAMLYTKRGRFSEACRLAERSIALEIKANGPESTSLAGSYHNLGLTYWQMGMDIEAETSYQKSIEMFKRGHGAAAFDDPCYAATLGNLGVLYHAQGRLHIAEPLYKEATAIMESSGDLDNPDFYNLLISYAALLRLTRRKKEAALVEAKANMIRTKLAQAAMPVSYSAD